MSSIELPTSQKDILRELINWYSRSERAVKGEDIANSVDRAPGTIRNQMQSLKALQLVEGVPGPKGGYKPTSNAYEALGIQDLDEPADVPLFHNGEYVEDANVQEIDLTNVHHPDLCRAEVRLHGSIKPFHDGDTVIIGPTPRSNLQIEGTLAGKDETDNVLIVSTTKMKAPARDEESSH
jgi:predicted transcriptional regulator